MYVSITGGKIVIDMEKTFDPPEANDKALALLYEIVADKLQSISEEFEDNLNN